MWNIWHLFDYQGPMTRFLRHHVNKYVGLRNCRAEMYADRVACCPLVSHDEYADGTDGRTPDRYNTLSTRRGQRT